MSLCSGSASEVESCDVMSPREWHLICFAISCWLQASHTQGHGHQEVGVVGWGGILESVCRIVPCELHSHVS